MYLAATVALTDEILTVELTAGRTISAPLAWYPRLLHASSAERGNWHLIAGGEGIHWPDVDEDISVSSLIAGRPSAENAVSLQRWLAGGRHRTEKWRRS